MAWPITRKTLTMVGLFAGTIVSVAGALSVFSIDVPRPIFNTDLILVEERILELDNVITSQQLNDSRLRLYQNQRESLEWQGEEGFVPDFLLEERVLLESEIRNLQQRLDDIRSESLIDN